MIRIVITDRNNPHLGRKEISGPKGSSLLEICEDNPRDVELNHSCGGFCACSTCHVIVESGAEYLSEREEDEEERLGITESATPQSRLGCQARLIASDGELVLTIPEVEF